jgi:hypothetical protein
MEPVTKARLFLYSKTMRGHEMELYYQLHIPNVLTPKKSPQYPLGMRLGESERAGLVAVEEK